MANPTYQSGFYAPGRGTALHPELWDGCVGAWDPGLGVSGLTLRDWSGFGNHGTLTNGPTWAANQGKYAINFDGVDDWVDTSFKGLSSVVEFTISFWIKRNSASTLGPFLGSFDSTAKRALIQAWSDNFLYIEIGDGSVSAEAYFAYSSVAWTHFVVVYNGNLTGNSNRLRLYQNGTLATLTFVATVPSTTQVIANGFQMGRTNGGAYYGSGQIDDVMIFNKSVPDRIQTLASRRGIAYERAPRKFYSLPAAAASGNPTGNLQNNIQSMRHGL